MQIEHMPERNDVELLATEEGSGIYVATELELGTMSPSNEEAESSEERLQVRVFGDGNNAVLRLQFLNESRIDLVDNDKTRRFADVERLRVYTVIAHTTINKGLLSQHVVEIEHKTIHYYLCHYKLFRVS
jgi:hypothetical protein